MAFTEISYRYGRLWHEEVMRVVWNTVLMFKRIFTQIFFSVNSTTPDLLGFAFRYQDVDRFVLDLAQKQEFY